MVLYGKRIVGIHAKKGFIISAQSVAKKKSSTSSGEPLNCWYNATELKSGEVDMVYFEFEDLVGVLNLHICQSYKL